MKALVLALSSFVLILLFWAVVLIGVTAGTFPRVDLANLPFFELIKTACSVVTAIAAVYALKTWRRTLKAQKRTEFLDQLLSSVLEYGGVIQEAISSVMSVKYRVAVVGYNACNDTDSRQLDDLTGRAYTALGKVNALVTNGDVFEFAEYGECRDSCNNMARIYNKLGLAAAILKQGGGPGQRAHPILSEALSLTDAEYRKLFEDQKNIMIAYVAKRYSEMHD